jgi:hypothetical protein
MCFRFILVLVIVVSLGCKPSGQSKAPPSIKTTVYLPQQYEKIQTHTNLSFTNAWGMRSGTEALADNGGTCCVFRAYRALAPLGESSKDLNSVVMGIVRGSSSTTVVVYSSCNPVEVEVPRDADYVVSARIAQTDDEMLSRIEVTPKSTASKKGETKKGAGAGEGTGGG